MAKKDKMVDNAEGKVFAATIIAIILCLVIAHIESPYAIIPIIFILTGLGFFIGYVTKTFGGDKQ
jgi:hypothetical protein